MKVITTPTEAMTQGYWLALCELKGINEWAVNEGLMDSSEEIILTWEEGLKLGIVEELK